MEKMLKRKNMISIEKEKVGEKNAYAQYIIDLAEEKRKNQETEHKRIIEIGNIETKYNEVDKWFKSDIGNYAFMAILAKKQETKKSSFEENKEIERYILSLNSLNNIIKDMLLIDNPIPIEKKNNEYFVLDKLRLFVKKEKIDMLIYIFNNILTLETSPIKTDIDSKSKNK